MTLRLRHLLEFWLMAIMAIIVRLLPWETSLRLGDWVGTFTFKVLKIRRRVTLDNLARAFPEKTAEELESIAHRAYQNFVKMTIEYIRFPDLTPQKVLAKVIVPDHSLLEWAMRNGKGAIFVGGHFGNWELMGAAIRALGYPEAFLVGEQHNKLIDDLMNRYRQRMGITIIHMGVAVRGVIKALREGKMVALLSDQDAGKNGVFVNYLGHPASTPRGPAVFSLKTGAPIIFGSAVREDHAYHRIYFDLATPGEVGELSEENVRRITQAYTSILERYVRQYPDHWFWMHRRWKTRPGGVRVE
ncbi:MAG: lysophospholipid acyltransferase family protein [candidate division KSB1 bacterium]|nr:lysophospholipid acyltransferase family protein [candidate division KSB1 bacterium]MDZ7294127.1 lysophospholipid acyltransferase family protein [candidate division KSB1 bacterium]MDZ7393181.1 lysophospholipid acyltransferase family protein [candidate division KSB1 bacterium]MDZ7412754.1 lysophospholipid acyltransferase family protein [candidate division KSB1 bacterium]